MALSAKLSSLSLGPDISSGRMPAGGRNVASVGADSVEEIAPKAGPQANENYNFMGFSKWMKSRQQPQQQQPRNTAGMLYIQSNAFLGLLSQYQLENDIAQPQNLARSSFLGVVTKAVRAYEGTAAVIYAQNAPRGSTMSLMI